MNQVMINRRRVRRRRGQRQHERRAWSWRCPFGWRDGHRMQHIRGRVLPRPERQVLRGRAADQVEQGEGVRAESSAGLDHEGQKLSVVAAGDGCVLLAFPAFCGLGSSGRVCWMLTAVGGYRCTTATSDSTCRPGYTICRSGRRSLPACRPFTSRTACPPVSSTARYKASLTAWWRALTSR